MIIRWGNGGRKLRFNLEETVPKINIIKGETIWVEHETKPHMIL